MTALGAAIRDLAPADVAWVHALNQANGEELSFMEAQDFEAMLSRARFARVLDPEAAFLLAYDQPPTTDSPNFAWVRQHYPQALYIDRIAVAPHARRQGVARQLYEDLFHQATTQGFPQIACEINATPPNPASDAFHAALGFQPVGEARLEGRGKTVRYYVCDL
jgi:uncharacterized protein